MESDLAKGQNDRDGGTGPPLSALLCFGLTASDVALAVGVSKRTVQRWLREETTPAGQYVRALNGLREAVAALRREGVDGPHGRQWLIGEACAETHGQRPIEVVGRDPYAVLAAVHLIGATSSTEGRRARIAGS